MFVFSHFLFDLFAVVPVSIGNHYVYKMAVAKLAVVVTVLAADHDANMRKCNYSCF